VLQYLNENSQSKQSPKRRKVSLSQKDWQMHQCDRIGRNVAL
jgi:hypothetical protein